MVEAAPPPSSRVPVVECLDDVDYMNRPMGARSRAALFAPVPANASYLNDAWVWRYPQLPWQPIASRDGTPRSHLEVGDSLPW